jgi:photosystem II stability/assembly factor-like uncharacterized protein
MNRIVAIAILLVSISASVLAQYNVVNTGVSDKLFDIDFPSEDTGYVVGGGKDGSIIFKTKDAGETWTTWKNSNSSLLYSVNFIDDNIGFACGFSGVMYKTIDGGDNWVELNTGTSEMLMSVYFIDKQIGYCVGNKGIIMKTIDGGNTWVNQISNSSEWLISVFFIGESVGYAVGTNGIVLKTVDGGDNWNTVSTNVTGSLIDVLFLNDSTGFCIGFDGVIIKTTDYGSTWESQNSTTLVDLQSISFINANDGYAVGNGPMVLKTQDGGSTWIRENSPAIFNLSDVFLTKNKVIISGDKGMLMTKESLLSLEEKESFSYVRIYPNPASSFISVLFDDHSKIEIINIYDSSGILALTSKDSDIDISGLSKGTYFLEIVTEDRTFNNRFVKN